MITGAHFLLYSKDPEADRAFFRDVLGFRWIDIGDRWLLFALPPSELAVHRAAENFVQSHADHNLSGAVLYLMCEDLKSTIQFLEARKPGSSSEIIEAEWGRSTTIRLPSGGAIGLYQPAHPTALDLELN
jgi:glyoxalase/bleomycin resistance protein/dioxygenase superfamily protein